MLISLENLSQKYQFKAKGIVHLGAHLAEELEDYLKHGAQNILWVDGNPKIFNLLCQKTSRHAGSRCVQAILSNQDNEEWLFRITNNGESSSILELKDHKKEHPTIYVQESVRVKTITYDSLVQKEKIDCRLYDFLSLDLQGDELMALEGMKETLKFFSYLYLEVNLKEIYKGCALKSQIDEFLASRGFIHHESKILEHGWGDAFYMKK